VQLAFKDNFSSSFDNRLGNVSKTLMQKYSQVEQQPVHRRCSRPLFFSFVVSSLLLGLACGCGTEKPTAATNDPDQLLRQMSEKLARKNA
jgi:hypothetical protein